MTPEGFLLCEGVKLARTGTLLYGAGEVPITPDGQGLVRIERHENEVFRPETLASINGKPFVDDHPDEDVTPSNWLQHTKGVFLNPRRGEGVDDAFQVADLIVYDPETIEKIDAGKVEISLGYDAEYQELDVGLGAQRNIVVNHGALVDKGRCGPACAIGDSAMTTKPKTLRDFLSALVSTKDTAAIVKTLDDEFDLGGRTDGVGGVTINLGQGHIAKTPDEESEDPTEERFKKMEDAMSEMRSMFDAFMKGSAADAEGDPDDETETQDSEGEEEEGKSERTGDAAFRANLEILAPGMRVPTIDAKADKKKARDTICRCKRRALDRAYATEEGKPIIDKLLVGKTKDFDKLTEATVSATFDAAAVLLGAANNAGFLPTFTPGKTNDANPIASLNKAHADFWKTH